MAAEHLLAVDGGFQAEVGEEGLGHRGQQGDHFFRAFAHGGIFAELGGVQLHGDVAGEGAAAFVGRFHGQQHAAHVGVDDDRVGGLVLGDRAGGRAALDAIAGVFHGALVGALAGSQALDANAQALVVHHGEHGRQALVRGVDDPAGGAVEVHHAGGRALDAHLVFDRAAGHGVLLAQRAVLVDQHLGHQEQRDALGAGRRVGQLGQHQVDDVLGQVVLAAGDEDLGAADLVAAVGLRFGLGADHAEVGAGVRLGQAHRAAPHAGVHVRQVLLLELFAGVRIQRQAGAGGEHRVEAERQVGGVDHFLDLGADHLGHAHAAELRRAADADPAAFGVGAVGLGEAGRGLHALGAPGAAFFVATAVQRGDHAAGDLAGFLEDRRGGVSVDHFSQRRQLGPQLGHFEDFIENEAHVAQGGFVVGHGVFLERSERCLPANSAQVRRSLSEQLFRHVASC
ncbi:hypothetical protein D9M69_428820 [compost metagenome]